MNELTSFTSITRKRYQAVSNASISTYKYNRIGLQLPQQCAILVTSQREETRPSGDNDGQISDRKRNCRDPESVRRHYHQTLKARQTRRLQSRELLEGKRERPARVHVQTEERSRQKIKATVGWQMATNKLVAVRAIGSGVETLTKAPRCRYLFLVYTDFCRVARSALYKLWVCDRQEVCTHE